MPDETVVDGHPPDVTCTVDAYQRVCVTAHVTVTPTAKCGTPTVTCLTPVRIVTGGTPPCPGGTLSPTGTCSFTIAQELCVKVPVSFGAKTDCETGSAYCFPPSASACT